MTHSSVPVEVSKKLMTFVAASIFMSVMTLYQVLLGKVCMDLYVSFALCEKYEYAEEVK